VSCNGTSALTTLPHLGVVAAMYLLIVLIFMARIG